ncbi:MAG: 3-dehydroquinate synthase family protein [Flavobacteriales bacterium]
MDSEVYTGGDAIKRFNEYVQDMRLYILLDEHTENHCLPKLHIPSSTTCIIAKSGEAHKNLHTAEQVIAQLADAGADRAAVLLCLGGGVICDLGGFVASVYKRGIRHILMPTTLMAQADAAFGGKSAVNVNNIRNLAGTIRPKAPVFAYPGFLATLPVEHLYSGYAEMIKHAILSDEEYLDELFKTDPLQIAGRYELVEKSFRIKMQIAEQDLFENNIRKLLNFGHTFAHAIEADALAHNTYIPHGYAVAAGMVCTIRLSVTSCGLHPQVSERIEEGICSIYREKLPRINSMEDVCVYMRYDKKNTGGKFGFVLLEKIGRAVMDRSCDKDAVMEALQHYSNLLN